MRCGLVRLVTRKAPHDIKIRRRAWNTSVRSSETGALCDVAESRIIGRCCAHKMCRLVEKSSKFLCRIVSGNEFSRKRCSTNKFQFSNDTDHVSFKPNVLKKDGSMYAHKFHNVTVKFDNSKMSSLHGQSSKTIRFRKNLVKDHLPSNFSYNKNKPIRLYHATSKSTQFPIKRHPFRKVTSNRNVRTNHTHFRHNLCSMKTKGLLCNQLPRTETKIYSIVNPLRSYLRDTDIPVEEEEKKTEGKILEEMKDVSDYGMGLLDGKVLNHLSETSYLSLCGCKSCEIKLKTYEKESIKINKVLNNKLSKLLNYCKKKNPFYQIYSNNNRDKKSANNYNYRTDNDKNVWGEFSNNNATDKYKAQNQNLENDSAKQNSSNETYELINECNKWTNKCNKIDQPHHYRSNIHGNTCNDDNPSRKVATNQQHDSYSYGSVSPVNNCHYNCSNNGYSNTMYTSIQKRNATNISCDHNSVIPANTHNIDTTNLEQVSDQQKNKISKSDNYSSVTSVNNNDENYFSNRQNNTDNSPDYYAIIPEDNFNKDSTEGTYCLYQKKKNNKHCTYTPMIPKNLYNVADYSNINYNTMNDPNVGAITSDIKRERYYTIMADNNNYEHYGERANIHCGNINYHYDSKYQCYKADNKKTIKAPSIQTDNQQSLICLEYPSPFVNNSNTTTNNPKTTKNNNPPENNTYIISDIPVAKDICVEPNSKAVKAVQTSGNEAKFNENNSRKAGALQTLINTYNDHCDSPENEQHKNNRLDKDKVDKNQIDLKGSNINESQNHKSTIDNGIYDHNQPSENCNGICHNAGDSLVNRENYFNEDLLIYNFEEFMDIKSRDLSDETLKNTFRYYDDFKYNELAEKSTNNPYCLGTSINTENKINKQDQTAHEQSSEAMVNAKNDLNDSKLCKITNDHYPNNQINTGTNDEQKVSQDIHQYDIFDPVNKFIASSTERYNEKINIISQGPNFSIFPDSKWKHSLYDPDEKLSQTIDISNPFAHFEPIKIKPDKLKSLSRYSEINIAIQKVKRKIECIMYDEDETNQCNTELLNDFNYIDSMRTQDEFTSTNHPKNDQRGLYNNDQCFNDKSENEIDGTHYEREKCDKILDDKRDNFQTDCKCNEQVNSDPFNYTCQHDKHSHSSVHLNEIIEAIKGNHDNSVNNETKQEDIRADTTNNFYKKYEHSPENSYKKYVRFNEKINTYNLKTEACVCSLDNQSLFNRTAPRYMSTSSKQKPFPENNKCIQQKKMHKGHFMDGTIFSGDNFVSDKGIDEKSKKLGQRKSFVEYMMNKMKQSDTIRHGEGSKQKKFHQIDDISNNNNYQEVLYNKSIKAFAKNSSEFSEFQRTEYNSNFNAYGKIDCYIPPNNSKNSERYSKNQENGQEQKNKGFWKIWGPNNWQNKYNSTGDNVKDKFVIGNNVDDRNEGRNKIIFNDRQEKTDFREGGLHRNFSRGAMNNDSGWGTYRRNGLGNNRSAPDDPNCINVSDVGLNLTSFATEILDDKERRDEKTRGMERSRRDETGESHHGSRNKINNGETANMSMSRESNLYLQESRILGSRQKNELSSNSFNVRNPFHMEGTLKHISCTSTRQASSGRPSDNDLKTDITEKLKNMSKIEQVDYTREEKKIADKEIVDTVNIKESYMSHGPPIRSGNDGPQVEEPYTHSDLGLCSKEIVRRLKYKSVGIPNVSKQITEEIHVSGLFPEGQKEIHGKLTRVIAKPKSKFTALSSQERVVETRLGRVESKEPTKFRIWNDTSADAEELKSKRRVYIGDVKRLPSNVNSSMKYMAKKIKVNEPEKKNKAVGLKEPENESMKYYSKQEDEEEIDYEDPVEKKSWKIYDSGINSNKMHSKKYIGDMNRLIMAKKMNIQDKFRHNFPHSAGKEALIWEAPRNRLYEKVIKRSGEKIRKKLAEQYDEELNKMPQINFVNNEGSASGSKVIKEVITNKTVSSDYLTVKSNEDINAVEVNEIKKHSNSTTQNDNMEAKMEQMDSKNKETSIQAITSELQVEKSNEQSKINLENLKDKDKEIKIFNLSNSWDKTKGENIENNKVSNLYDENEPMRNIKDILNKNTANEHPMLQLTSDITTEINTVKHATGQDTTAGETKYEIDVPSSPHGKTDAIKENEKLVIKHFKQFETPNYDSIEPSKDDIKKKFILEASMLKVTLVRDERGNMNRNVMEVPPIENISNEVESELNEMILPHIEDLRVRNRQVLSSDPKGVKTKEFYYNLLNPEPPSTQTDLEAATLVEKPVITEDNLDLVADNSKSIYNHLVGTKHSNYTSKTNTDGDTRVHKTDVKVDSLNEDNPGNKTFKMTSKTQENEFAKISEPRPYADLIEKETKQHGFGDMNLGRVIRESIEHLYIKPNKHQFSGASAVASGSKDTLQNSKVLMETPRTQQQEFISDSSKSYKDTDEIKEQHKPTSQFKDEKALTMEQKSISKPDKYETVANEVKDIYNHDDSRNLTTEPEDEREKVKEDENIKNVVDTKTDSMHNISEVAHQASNKRNDHHSEEPSRSIEMLKEVNSEMVDTTNISIEQKINEMVTDRSDIKPSIQLGSKTEKIINEKYKNVNVTSEIEKERQAIGNKAQTLDTRLKRPDNFEDEETTHDKIVGMEMITGKEIPAMRVKHGYEIKEETVPIGLHERDVQVNDKKRGNEMENDEIKREISSDTSYSHEDQMDGRNRNIVNQQAANIPHEMDSDSSYDEFRIDKRYPLKRPIIEEEPAVQQVEHQKEELISDQENVSTTDEESKYFKPREMTHREDEDVSSWEKDPTYIKNLRPGFYRKKNIEARSRNYLENEAKFQSQLIKNKINTMGKIADCKVIDCKKEKAKWVADMCCNADKQMKEPVLERDTPYHPEESRSPPDNSGAMKQSGKGHKSNDWPDTLSRKKEPVIKQPFSPRPPWRN